MPDIVVLSDRIKETSNDTGTDNLVLDGAAVGFSAFGEFYSHSDAVYYAILMVLIMRLVPVSIWMPLIHLILTIN